MATVEKQLLGTVATLMSTELNSLASSTTAGAISSVVNGTGIFNNTVGGGGGDGFVMGQLELAIGAPAGTLTANTAANVWLLQNVDGSNYEDGGAAVIPARAPDVVIPVRPVSTAQRTVRRAAIPPGNWFILVQHNTGQTWAASGNTLKLLPDTFEGV
jgi:hypothetical protein